MDNLIKQLTAIRNKLNNPFPYSDTDRIQVDFRTEFLNLSDEENCLTGDFNTYCMNVAGTLSYVLAEKSSEIPKRQIEFLQNSFFGFFKQYQFLEDKICNYKDFFDEYKNIEITRKLLLQVLK